MNKVLSLLCLIIRYKVRNICSLWSYNATSGVFGSINNIIDISFLTCSASPTNYSTGLPDNSSPPPRRRNRRQPRHFDSSPNLDRSRRCEWACHFLDHLETIIRDFIDEDDERECPACNACYVKDVFNISWACILMT